MTSLNVSLYGPELFEPSTAVSAGNIVALTGPSGAGLVVTDNTLNGRLSNKFNIYLTKNLPLYLIYHINNNYEESYLLSRENKVCTEASSKPDNTVLNTEEQYLKHKPHGQLYSGTPSRCLSGLWLSFHI